MIKSESWLNYLDGWERWSLKEGSKQAREIVAKGILTEEEMEGMAEAWKAFAEMPVSEKSFGLKCGEVVCVK